MTLEPERTRNTVSPVQNHENDSLVAVVDEYLAMVEAGQVIDVSSFADRHPEFGSELRDCIEALNLVARVAPNVASRLDDDAERLAPMRKVGDFRIFREIGRGGMGVVYEAEQLSLGRSVALKIMPYAALLDQKAITRFRNEARAAATLDHPHIVPVYAVGNERSIYYYAMSLIDGLTMADLIDHLGHSVTLHHGSTHPLAIEDYFQLAQRTSYTNDRHATQADHSPRVAPGRTTVTDFGDATGGATTSRELQAAISTHRSRFDRKFFRSVARLGGEAAEALHHAHERGIVHRDIKPGNLMIDGDAKLWITDFGLAHIESDVGVTMTGDLIGTLRYMAPEQALGLRVVVDHRADIYSLGASLYELIALRPPFLGTNREILLHQIAVDEPKSLRQLNRSVPSDLALIIHKALAKDPEDRYSTAREMAEDLQRYCENLPTLARRPSLTRRAFGWSRRHPTLVAVALAVALVLGIASSVSSLLLRKEAIRATKQYQRAEKAEGEARAAEQRALTQATRAEVAASNAESINRFLTDYVFARADPSRLGDGGRNGFRGVLDDALPYVDAQFPDDPGLRAALYISIGQLNRKLGEFQKSKNAFVRALELIDDLYTPDVQPQRLEAMLALGQSLAELSEHQQAETLFSECKQLAEQEEIDQPFIAEEASLQLAVTLLQLGNRQAAQHLAQQYFDQRVARLGQSHPDSARAAVALASTLEDSPDDSNAVDLLLFACGILKDNPGVEDWETQQALFQLADYHQQRGQYSEAEALVRELYEIRLQIHGSDHPLTLAAMDVLVDLFESAGRLVEAEAALRGLIQTRRRIWGDGGDTSATIERLRRVLWKRGNAEDYATLIREVQSEDLQQLDPAGMRSAVQYCELLNATGQYRQAEQLLKTTWRTAKEALGEGHPTSVACMNALVYSVAAQRRIFEAKELGQGTLPFTSSSDVTNGMAEELAMAFIMDRESDPWTEDMLRDSLDFKLRTLPKTHPSVALTLAVLGHKQILNNDFRGAKQTLQECLRIRRASLPKTNWLIAETESMLGECLVEEGKLQQAQPLLESAYQVVSQNESLADYHRSEFVERLLRLHQATGDADTERKWHVVMAKLLRSTLRDWKRRVAISDARYLETASRLAESLAALGEFTDAEAILLTAYTTGLVNNWDSDPHQKFGYIPHLDRIREALPELYNAWGKPAEAEAWRQLVQQFGQEVSDSEEKLQAHQVAHDFWTRKCRREPKLLYRLRLAKAFYDMGRIHVGRKQIPQALDLLERSLQAIDKVLNDAPEDHWGLGCKVHVCEALAELLETDGRCDESLRMLEQAAAIGRVLGRRQESNQPALCKHASTAPLSLAMLLANCSDLSLRDPQRAIELANSVEPENPNEKQLVLAIAHYRMGKMRPAIQNLESQLHNRDARFIRAMAYSKLGHQEDAMFELDTGLSRFYSRQVIRQIRGMHDPASEKSFSIRLMREAAETLDIENNRFESLAAYWLGIAYQAQGMSVDATESFMHSAELDPTNPAPHLGMAEAIVESPSEDVDNGFLAIQKYLELKGNQSVDAKAYTLLGILHGMQGDAASAFSAMRQAVELTPSEGTAYQRLAQVFDKRTDYESAVRALQQALELSPKNVEFLNNMAWFLANCPDTDVRDASQAIELASTATQLEPLQASFWNTLGVAQYRGQRYSAAIESILKSIELSHEESPYDTLFLAMSYWQLDRRQEAAQWYQNSLDRIKNTPDPDEELTGFQREARVLMNFDSESSSSEPPTSGQVIPIKQQQHSINGDVVQAT